MESKLRITITVCSSNSKNWNI